MLRLEVSFKLDHRLVILTRDFIGTLEVYAFASICQGLLCSLRGGSELVHLELELVNLLSFGSTGKRRSFLLCSRSKCLGRQVRSIDESSEMRFPMNTLPVKMDGFWPLYGQEGEF